MNADEVREAVHAWIREDLSTGAKLNIGFYAPKLIERLNALLRRADAADQIARLDHKLDPDTEALCDRLEDLACAIGNAAVDPDMAYTPASEHAVDLRRIQSRIRRYALLAPSVGDVRLDELAKSLERSRDLMLGAADRFSRLCQDESARALEQEAADITALLQARQANGAGSAEGWQDISTAPKDETRVDVLHDDGEVLWCAKWVSGLECFGAPYLTTDGDLFYTTFPNRTPVGWRVSAQQVARAALQQDGEG